MFSLLAYGLTWGQTGTEANLKNDFHRYPHRKSQPVEQAVPRRESSPPLRKLESFGNMTR